jgi:hypothetical protein
MRLEVKCIARLVQVAELLIDSVIDDDQCLVDSRVRVAG